MITVKAKEMNPVHSIRYMDAENATMELSLIHIFLFTKFTIFICQMSEDFTCGIY